MRRSLVLSCLASSTQQMNSLRASGVMSFQASSAVPFAISALRRSEGKSWTTPPGTRWPVMAPVYPLRKLARDTKNLDREDEGVALLDSGAGLAVGVAVG